MVRFLVVTVLVVASGASVLAQPGPQQGVLKKVDPAARSLTLQVGDSETTLVVAERAEIRGADGQPLAAPFEKGALRPGARVMFQTRERDGQRVLVRMRLLGARESAPSGGGIQRGKVKQIDPEQKSIRLTVAGKEETYPLSENTQVPGATGRSLKERLQGFKEGSDVLFRLERRDGKAVVLGLRLIQPGEAGGRSGFKPVDSSQLKPLTELGKGRYRGYQGGLYPDGSNQRPAAHEAKGVALAKQVRPLDRDGKPGDDGKIVLLSVGMSNTSQLSQGFARHLAADREKNPRLVFVNGAQGGMTAAAIQDPDDGRSGTRYWAEVDNRLRAAGVSRAQVQAVWIKQADAGPSQGFPAYARRLQEELTRIVRLLPQRFPNVKLVYLSSRTYGGYARTPLNPEPYAYESGFSVKWLIERQLAGAEDLAFEPNKGPVQAPWLSWGPYLWVNGATKRADGFFTVKDDFAADGTHHAPAGQDRVGRLILQFFRTDSTTRPWMLRPDAPAPDRD